MNDKTLSILGVTAAALLVTSIIVGTSDSTVQLSFTEGQPLVESLDFDDVAKVVVKKGDDEVTLVKEGAVYRIDELYSYPADPNVVGRLIRQVDSLECESQVTDDEGDYDELDGTHQKPGAGPGTASLAVPANIAGPNEFCTEVAFFDRSGTVLSRILVTDNVQTSDESTVRYARVEGDPMVYRVKGATFFPPTQPINMVDRVVVALDETTIDSVRVRPSGRDAYRIEFVDVSDEVEAGAPPVKPVLQDVPEGLRQIDAETRRVATALRSLRLTSVKPASELASEVGDIEFSSLFAVDLKDGGTRTVELGQDENGKWWARVGASADRVWPPKEPASPPTTEEEAAQVRAARLAGRAAYDAAVEFESRHNGWVYEISSFTADTLMVPIEDLCEDASLPAEVTASRILIPWAGAVTASGEIERTKEEAEALARDLYDQIVADPEVFSELAEEHSTDTRSNTKGGSMGPAFNIRKYDTEFSEAVFRLKVGELFEGPLETPRGYQIIRRDS